MDEVFGRVMGQHFTLEKTEKGFKAFNEDRSVEAEGRDEGEAVQKAQEKIMTAYFDPQRNPYEHPRG